MRKDKVETKSFTIKEIKAKQEDNLKHSEASRNEEIKSTDTLIYKYYL